MKHLYVAWQDDGTREWIPVAMLTEKQEGYELKYTLGAKRCKSFTGFGRMVALDKVYYSNSLFPFFQNRMISKSRPEYKSYLKWLGLNEVTGDPMSVMSVTGGLRATDSFELIPASRQEGNTLVVDFFPRGLRHMSPSITEFISSLSAGTRLYLLSDFQNSFDPNALLLRTDNPKILVGYMAKYYGSGLNKLLQSDATDVVVEIKQVNIDAPLDMKLLCTLKAPLRDGINFLESENDFQPWTSDGDQDAVKNAVMRASSVLGKEFGTTEF